MKTKTTTTPQSIRFATMGLITMLFVGACTIDVDVVERVRCIQSQQYSIKTQSNDGVPIDYPIAFAVDNAGNAFVAGYLYNSVIDFDGMVVESTAGCSYLAELDPEGKLRWFRKFGGGEVPGIDTTYVKSLSTDTSGNVAMLLFTYHSFLLGGHSLGGDDMLTTVKFSAQGKYQWSYNWGKDEAYRQHEIIFDSNGAIIVASTMMADSAYASTTPGFLGKLNGKTGALVWKRDFNALEVHLSSVVGNKVFVGGTFVDAVNFGGTQLLQSATSGFDAFVGKLDSDALDNATLVGDKAWSWIKPFDGPGDQDQQCTGLASDSSGNVVAAIWNEKWSYFDNDPQSPSTTCSATSYLINPANSYLVKLDGTYGSQVWRNARWGSLVISSGADEFVVADSDQAGPSRCGKPQGVDTLQKLDADGHPLWDLSWKTAFDYYIASNRSGEVFHFGAFGAFGDTIDFGCGPMTVTDKVDLYLAKLPP